MLKRFGAHPPASPTNEGPPLLSDHRDRSADPRALLEAVSTAAILPSEAGPKLYGLIADASACDAPEAIYEALRGAVWHLVSGREDGSHLDLWADVVLRLRQVLRDRRSALSERFTVLADLLDQSARFPKLHPRRDLARRKHVAPILSMLSLADGPTRRGAIARGTGLKEANLSRILANLVSAGLVSRRYEGRDAILELTSEGALEAARLAVPSRVDPLATSHALVRAFPVTAVGSARVGLDQGFEPLPGAIREVSKPDGTIAGAPRYLAGGPMMGASEATDWKRRVEEDEAIIAELGVPDGAGARFGTFLLRGCSSPWVAGSCLGVVGSAADPAAVDGLVAEAESVRALMLDMAGRDRRAAVVGLGPLAASEHDGTVRWIGPGDVPPGAAIPSSDRHAYGQALRFAVAAVAGPAPSACDVDVRTVVTDRALVTCVHAASDIGWVACSGSRNMEVVDLVRRIGGEFAFRSSPSDGVSAEFSWPVVPNSDPAGDRTIPEGRSSGSG